MVCIALVSFLLGCIPLTIYLLYFKGPFSTQNSDWGDFGSFIGGSSGALLSTLSLLVLIYTLFVTIQNSKDMLKNQKENHNEQINIQEKIHRNERDLTRFSLNNQLLATFIGILNKKLTSKKYALYSQLSGSMQLVLAKDAIPFLISSLDARLASKTHTGKDAIHAVMDDLKLDFFEEMIPLLSIIGIIRNEPNYNFRVNFIAIFHASTERLPIFWLIHYASVRSAIMSEALDNEPDLNLMPREILAVFKKNDVDAN